MSKCLRRVLALILALAMVLPIGTALADEYPEQFSVIAKGLLRDTEHEIELVGFRDRIYISAEEAAQLCGLRTMKMGKQIRFFGENLHYGVDEGSIESLILNDEQYFLLEPLMDKLQTYLIVNGDGNLYYNSVPENKTLLLEQTERILAQSYYSADYLDDMGPLADAALGVATVWDVVMNLRFNAFWGEAYEEDLRDQLMKLMLPLEGTTDHLITVLQEGEELTQTLSTVLELGDKGINSLADAASNWDMLPKETWELLFASEDLTDFEKAVHTTDYVVSGDVFEEYILSLFASSDAAEYQAVKDAMRKGKGFDVEIFSLSDLLSVGSYFVTATQAAERYVVATELVTDYFYHDDFSTVHAQARQVSSDCRDQLNSNSGEIIGRFATELFETMPSNISESVIESFLLPKAGLVTFLTKSALEGIMKLDSKTQAVRTAALCTKIQSMFAAAYQKAVEDNLNSEVMLAAMQMYLKCAWQSADAFSFDEEIPLARIKSCIEADMVLLASFDARLFSVKPNSLIFTPEDFAEDGVEATQEQIGIFEMLAAAVFTVTESSDQFLYGYVSPDDLTEQAKMDAVNMLIKLWAGDYGEYKSTFLHVDDLNQFTDALFSQTIYQVKNYPEHWDEGPGADFDTGMDPDIWTIVYPEYDYDVQFVELRMEDDVYVVTCHLDHYRGWEFSVTFRAVEAENLVGYCVLNAEFREAES